MDKLLSIIVPTYNMEALLGRCLDSLLVNTCLDTLEVFIINDGSKDNSSRIGHEYEQKYPNTFHVIDKPNGNYGSCINTALHHITGKYVKVLDADDRFNTQALEMLLQRLSKTDADVILLNYIRIYADSQERRTYPYADNETIDLTTTPAPVFDMHNIAYKHDIFNRFNYHQTEGISYTDNEWIFYPMRYAASMQYFNLDVYLYSLDREGQTMDREVFIRNLLAHHLIFKKILYYMIKNKDSVSDSFRQYAEAMLYMRMEMIYRFELVYNTNKTYNKKSLMELDRLVAQYNCTFYKSFNKIPFRKIPFVWLFRKYHCRIPTIIRKICFLYKRW